MMHGSVNRHNPAWFKPLVLLAALLAVLACGAGALAEGSLQLNPNGSNRVFVEWMDDNNYYSTGSMQVGIVEERLYRRQILKVYAMDGETIYFGSSVHDATTRTVSGSAARDRDIGVRVPGAGAIEYFDVQDTANIGYIATRAMELAGPSQISAGGYNAFKIDVREGTAYPPGEYIFELYSRGNSYATTDAQNPKGLGSNSYPSQVLTQNGWANIDQRGTVAAWDITVADAANNVINGRVYTDYLSLNAGAHQRSIYPTVYVLTSDGYQYRTDFNGLQPFGMMFFANNRGLINMTTDQSFYHSGVYTDNTCTRLKAHIGFMFPDDSYYDGKNFTYRIFFNQPDTKVLEWLHLLSAAEPEQPSNFEFNYGNAVKKGAGGVFTFNCANQPAFHSVYQIEIFCDTSDANNRVYLSGECVQGVNSITWDGRDINGAEVPMGSYRANLVVKGGEYHFPYADIEGNPNGIIIELLNPPTTYAGYNPYNVFYDNSDITINGESLDFATNWDASWGARTELDGVDSSSGAMKYNYNYGDVKLFDIWTYFESPLSTAGTVVRVTDVGSLAVTKTVVGAAPPQGDSFTFTLLNGSSVVRGFEYTLNGSATKFVAVNGQFALKDGQTATIGNLEAKAGYTVVETAPTSATGSYSTVNRVNGVLSQGALATDAFAIPANASVNVSYENEYTRVVTPTPTPVPTPTPPAPGTGDKASPLLWLALTCAALGCIAVGARWRKRGRE